MQLMPKLSEATNLSSEIIRTAASLLFYTITTLKKYVPDEDLRGLVQEQSKGLVHSVHKEIVTWMQRVYGNIFGSPVGTEFYLLLCATEELEVRILMFMNNFYGLFCLQFCQSLYKLDCPQHIRESWKPAILLTIKDRIKKVVCDYCY
jgi:hypothetical protein